MAPEDGTAHVLPSCWSWSLAVMNVLLGGLLEPPSESSGKLFARRGGFEVHATLEAEEGETLALLGPNGAGKTSVVLALAGLIDSSGSIELDGARIDALPPERRPLGIAFQGGALFPHLSAIANVAFPLRAQGVGRRQAYRDASVALSRLAPDVRSDALPAALSGGEAQRVALARAVVHRPRLWRLDEPSSGLDVRGRVELRPALLETLATFAGVRLLVTHDPVEAMTLADRVVILEEGRITQQGTFDDVRRTHRSRYAAELVGVNLFTGRLDPIEGGAGRLVTSDGDVVVGWPEDPPAEHAGRGDRDTAALGSRGARGEADTRLGAQRLVWRDRGSRDPW